MLVSRVEKKVETSLKTSIPSPFPGSNPIHLQLENDLSRYVTISFPRQVVVAGFSIQTPEKAALKEFSVFYFPRTVEFPTEAKFSPQLTGAGPFVSSNLRILFSKGKPNWATVRVGA